MLLIHCVLSLILVLKIKRNTAYMFAMLNHQKLVHKLQQLAIKNPTIKVKDTTCNRGNISTIMTVWTAFDKIITYNVLSSKSSGLYAVYLDCDLGYYRNVHSKDVKEIYYTITCAIVDDENFLRKKHNATSSK